MATDEIEGSLLQITLDAAIPCWIMELKLRPWSYLEMRAADASQMIAEKGDVILFRGKKKGETARAFNALAEGIAILAFYPGGVRIFNRHWVAEHPEGTKQS